MTQFEVSEEDEKHIRRLQALRETSATNMFDDLKWGLQEVFGDEDGAETYEWVTENYEYYESGEWIDADV